MHVIEGGHIYFIHTQANPLTLPKRRLVKANAYCESTIDQRRIRGGGKSQASESDNEDRVELNILE